MRKATGKYYAPEKQTFTAKKYMKKYSPTKKPFIDVKSVLCICICFAVLLTGILVIKSLCSDKNANVEISSGNQLINVDTYPRIVSAKGKLSQSFIPKNLVSLNTVPNGEYVMLRSDAAESFINMLTAMADDGLAVIPVKGYTTYDEQQKQAIKAKDLLIAAGHSTDDADVISSKKICTPGEDESQLGTSVDIATDINDVERFDTTDQYKWICTNSQKYGYIVRYTADKEDITGVEAKPWRIRYVGVEAAEYMKNENLCLEEYVDEVISQNPNASQVD